MSTEFEQALQKYADVVVKVGLNLQPGQRLVIANFADLGVPLHAAPLVRQIASAAYAAGARFADVQWGDDQLQLIRFQQAPRDSFTEYPAWQANGALAYTQRGDALLILYANDPDLLKDQDADLVATLQQATNRQLEPLLAHFAGNAMNWSVISAAIPGWAAKVFPDCNARW